MNFINTIKSFFIPKVVTENLVQIKVNSGYYNLYLMRANDSDTLNTEWKNKNPYLYYNSSSQVVFGNNNQTPSKVGNSYLEANMLQPHIAEKLLKHNTLCLSKTEYNLNQIIQTPYLKKFKY